MSLMEFLQQTSKCFHLGQKNFNALTEASELTAELVWAEWHDSITAQQGQMRQKGKKNSEAQKKPLEN